MNEEMTLVPNTLKVPAVDDKVLPHSLTTDALIEIQQLISTDCRIDPAEYLEQTYVASNGE